MDLHKKVNILCYISRGNSIKFNYLINLIIQTMKIFIKVSLVVMLFIVGVSFKMKPKVKNLSSLNWINIRLLESVYATSYGDAACYESDPDNYCDQNGSYGCFWTSMPKPGTSECGS